MAPAPDSGGARRAILKAAAIGAASLLPIDTASASTEQDTLDQPTRDSQGPPGFEHGGGARADLGTAWLRSDGQRVSLGSSHSEWQRPAASDIDGIPDDARRVPYAAIQAQVQAITAALDRGQLRIAGTTDAGQPVLRDTGPTSRHSETDGRGP